MKPILSTIPGLLCLSLLCNPALGQSFDDAWDDAWGEDDIAEREPWLTGFVEQSVGSRWSDSRHHNDISLQDSRMRLEYDAAIGDWSLAGKADLYYDGVLHDWRDQVRELSAQTSFGPVDIKAGRQILTWGTGDYLFLNDFFPKDWQSFFAGRQDEYLKAPSDSIKLSFYGQWANVNLVWTPEFEPDNYINGDYVAFFDRLQQSIAAPRFLADAPNDDEWALRVYKNVGSNEWALYAYRGYFKSPNALTFDDDQNAQYTFTRLDSVGASWRRPLGSGLFNTEIAYHDSKDDSNGRDPLVSNSQWRFLLAYERELLSRLTGSLQFYVERTQHYRNLIASSPNAALEPEKNRTLVTTRLTWRDARDKLTLSLFAFISPSDRDAYLRPSMMYRFNDHWQLSTGLNWFTGQERHSFFGQFEDNNNAYVRIRYSF